MAKNTSFALGEHFAGFVESQVSTGRFGTASEVVRAGLRLLEEHEAKVLALQDALIAGEESGAPRAFDNDAFTTRMLRQHEG
jgi:antitoxin ParD1/3/4